VMALPIQGLWTSLRRTIAGSPREILRDPRRSASKIAAEQCGEDEKKAILDKFHELEKSTKERKEALKKKVEMFMVSGDVDTLQDDADPENAPEEVKKEVEKAEKAAEEGNEKDGQDGEEAPEPEMTEDERRGYERAMRELAKKK
jgi:hypothetical protein